MIYRRTLKVPVHYRTNKGKREKLEDLIARLTYTVRLWSRIIEENDIKHRKELQDLRHQHRVQKETGLSACFVQQAGNKALWMWKQYIKSHKKWKCMLSKTKKGTKWHEKLKKREPLKPFSSKHSKLKKIPTRFDYRTGVIKKVKNLELTNWIIKISTLKKYQKLTILLNPSEYHKKKLSEAEKICDFEIVWDEDRKKFMVHITCLFISHTQKPEKVRGIDLGIRRYASEVLMKGEPLKPIEFSNFKGKEKLKKLQELNDRIAHLRRKEKWKVLKKLRHKRRDVAVDFDRKYTKTITEKYKKELIVIGNPKYIRYYKFRGNGNKLERRLLRNWSFSRIIQYIKEKCGEKGIKTIIIREWNTSSYCHKCGGKVIRNPVSRIKCRDCSMEYDADYNACIKLIQEAGSSSDVKSLELMQNRAGATDELALNWRGLGRSDPTSPEATPDSGSSQVLALLFQG